MIHHEQSFTESDFRIGEQFIERGANELRLSIQGLRLLSGWIEKQVINQTRDLFYFLLPSLLVMDEFSRRVIDECKLLIDDRTHAVVEISTF